MGEGPPDDTDATRAETALEQVGSFPHLLAFGKGECTTGLGAVLLQRIEGKERVISFASQTLSKYSTWEKEALAVLWATRTFRMYLLSRHFTVVTDNTAITQLLESPAANAGGRLLRWSMALSDFTYTIRHRPGKLNTVCDALSRFPIEAGCTEGVVPDDTDPFDYSHMSVLCGIEQCHSSTSFFTEADMTAWTHEDICREQTRDQACSKIRGNDTFSEGFFKDEHGVLRKRHVRGAKSNISTSGVIVVPLSLRAFYLYRHHTLPIAGHRGVKRTRAILQSRVWWKGMRNDIARWIRACLICCKRKPPRPVHNTIPSTVCDSPRPWHTVSIDIVSADEGTESEQGYKYILTCIDTFSRWVICNPLKEISAATVAQALFDHLVCQKGRPSRLISDNASNFLAPAVVELCSRWKIHKIETGPYNQHANPVERWHRTLNALMYMLTGQFGRLWSKFLPAASFIYNSSRNDSTGYSPYAILFGHDPDLIEEVAWDITAAKSWATMEDYFKDTSSRLHAAYKFVVKHQERVATTNRLIAHKRSKEVSFEVGDPVLLWEPTAGAHAPSSSDKTKPAKGHLHFRWNPTWSGPHKIVARTKDGRDYAYTIHHFDTAKDLTNIRADKLALFNPWSEDIESTSGEIDQQRPYKLTGTLKVGDLVAIPAKAPIPFLIGTIIAKTPYQGIHIHVFGAPKTQGRNFRAPLQPLWKATTPTGTIFAVGATGAPDTNFTRHTCHVKVDTVILHAFKLTEKLHCVPAVILRVLSCSPAVWWRLPPSALGH